MEHLVRKNIRSMKPYSCARDEYEGETGIFLDANENPYGKWNRYPDPYQSELKEKLSEIKSVSKENIFIGNGSDEVIDLLIRIFCEPKEDQILALTPTYGMYEVSAATNNVEILKVPLNSDFQIDRTSLFHLFSNLNIKIIFLCSPNNPTGNLLKNIDIQWIIGNFKGIVVIDEAYIDFCESKSWNQKILSSPRLVVTQTMSKAWGMAAARIGIAFAQKSIIDLLNKVKPPYNVSELNQQAAVQTLANQELFEAQKKMILQEKKRIIQAFEKSSLVKKIYPSDANFVLIEVQNADEMYENLIKNKIIVRNRNTVVKNCLRISVGTAAENDALLHYFL